LIRGVLLGGRCFRAEAEFQFWPFFAADRSIWPVRLANPGGLTDRPHFMAEVRRAVIGVADSPLHYRLWLWLAQGQGKQ
jgi:hypothetical protein